MDKWTFNAVLFSRLTSVLDLSINEMAKRTDIGQQTLNRYISGKYALPVDILIQMCNHLRMPSYFFVSENNKHDIPIREIVTLSADRWQPVSWDCQAVEHTFGDGGGRIFWKDVAEVMGLTPNKPHARWLLQTRFTVAEFLKVCSHFDLSPFTFLIDHNREGHKQDGKHGASPTLLQEVKAMRKDIVTLTATTADLTNKYQTLIDQYDALFEAHKALLQRFNDHLNESYIGMAAEDIF